MSDKVVLAYSGGLDTSVAIKWLKENYNLDVIAVTIDVGNERDFSAIEQKALKVGAVKSLVIDAKELFVKYFVFPALQADALYHSVGMCQSSSLMVTGFSFRIDSRSFSATTVTLTALVTSQGFSPRPSIQSRKRSS